MKRNQKASDHQRVITERVHMSPFKQRSDVVIRGADPLASRIGTVGKETQRTATAATYGVCVISPF